MPWIALDSGGEKAIPEDVPDHSTVRCPACDGKMSPRGPTSDGKARHFVHHSRISEKRCGGGSEGESDQHRKMKSMALSGLRQWFGPMLEDSGPEVKLDVSRTGSDASIRRADVHVKFVDTHPLFGDTLAVEVQYRNHSKDVDPVTHDYVTLGVSVFWASEENFEDDRFNMHDLVREFQGGNHQKAVAAPDCSPLEFDPVVEPEPAAPSKEGLSTGESERGNVRPPAFDVQGLPEVDDEGHPIPHVPDCKHDYPIDRGYNDRMGFVCVKCGLTSYRKTGSWMEDGQMQRRSLIVIAPSGLTSTNMFGIRNSVKLESDDDNPPYCRNRTWEVDYDDDLYICLDCSREFPRQNDELRAIYGNNRPAEDFPESG